MKVLVTGGAGFIGSNFIRYVLEKHKDWEVINLDKLGYGSNLANLKDIEDDERYTFVKGDINDFELVKEFIKEVDAVINFAAESHVDRSISNPYSFIESNVLGVYTILEAIRKVNPEVRFVHISSVTGDTPVLLRNKETGEIFLARIDFLNEENYYLYEALTIDEDLKTTFMPISGIVKHPTDEIYEIEYEGGGKIKATGSHSVFVFTEDGIKEKYVTELKEGEYLVTLLTFNKNNFESNHVLRIRDYIDMKKIKTSGRIKKSLKTRERVLKILKDGPKTWKELVESVGKSVSQSLKSMVKEGLIEVVNGRYRITEKGLTELRNGFEEMVYVLYRRQLNIPQEIEEIEITPELMWLFGLYLAEGHASNTEKEFKRKLKKVTITTRDLESLKKAKKLLEKYFGYKKAVIRKKKRGDAYQLEFSGEILHSVFSEWGSTSENKRIPSWVWKLSRDHIAKMLEGYEGDAHIRKDDSRTFTSKNQTLIFSLVWLTRLKGINSRYGKRVCKNMKGEFQKREEYDLVMHDLVVSSENYEKNKLVRTPHSKCIPLGVVKVQLPKKVVAKYNLKKNKLVGKEIAKRLIKGKNKYVDSDIGVAKVKKITRIDEEVMVYDIVIEGNHKFFGGNVPILLHNTDEVYGDIEKGSFTEEDRLMPSSPYSASKAAGDMLVLGYARTYNLNASITRCTNNYGPYQFPEKLIPKTIIRASMGLKIPIYGTGQNVRDWLYVLDHCEAIELVLEKGERRGVYNISAGEEKTNLEVVRTILKLMGKDEELIEFVEDRPGHDLRYSLDSTKIREQLDWKPKHDFKEGIKKTVEWYLDNEWWWRPLVNEKVLHPTPWKLRW
ncbi:MAG: GDP-mannose 4,6-dehydratase [Candidatus Marinimicrobia bacterium]|nr:GDP-mannose 4,6-dehydratase [Candidatus Neomarinimicrobiota bacterium]